MSEVFIKRLLSSIILITVIIFFLIKESFVFNLIIIICFFISSYEWIRMNKSDVNKIFGLLFLILSFFTVYKLVNYAGNYAHFMFILLICVLTDVGGYIFGNLLKGPKLTSISPNKTYTGVFGSYLLPLIFSLLFLRTDYIFPQAIKFDLDIILFIILISTVSQIGDLLISYFKRSAKIKDTGKIIPGHGGLLDRIDGMIFAFPVAYLYLSTNTFVNLLS